ncbi:hypothetical protein OG21DRAFT_831128 [Imleria badia]|nr:hypothetical protein OG21DRAFT_831128 [Imleria badia]
MPGPSIDHPLLPSLTALHAQFTALHDSIGAVQSDVKDALAQLHALRTAQSKTDKGVADLEVVVGTRPKRPKRGRGRGRGKALIPGEAVLDLEDVPEKTLLQSVAAIQSAIEVLLARDSRASPLHPSQSQLATSSISSPSSLSSIATPDFTISPPLAAPDKEYAHASIQACPISPAYEPSCSLSHSHGSLALEPAHPSVDAAMLAWFASNSVRPTALTAAYLAHFLRDAHLPAAPNTHEVTESHAQSGDGDHPPTASDTQLPLYVTSPRTSSFYTNERSSSGTQCGDAPSSLGASVEPATATETPSSPAKISSQPSEFSLTSVGVDDEMTPPRTGPPHTSLASPLSSLTPLSSSRATSMSALSSAPSSLGGASGSEVHVDCPGGSRGPEGAQMTSDETLVIREAKTILESTSTRRQSSPVATDPDDEGLPSCLPTPPSETVPTDRAHIPSRATRDPDPNLIQMLPTRFPVIPTPPLTPRSAVGRLSVEEGVRGSSDFSEEHIDTKGSVGDAAEEVNTDARMNDTMSMPSPRRDPAGVDAPTLATDTQVPALTLPNDSAFNDGSSQVTPMPDNVDISKTPRSSVSQPPSANDFDIDMNDPPYPPPHHDGYDLRFSSPPPRLSPPASTMPSQYTTPAPSDALDAFDVHPTPDEDEVWHALMLGASGVSTPISMSGAGSGSMLLSYQSSREASQPLSIDPSVLHVHPPPPPELSFGRLLRVYGSDGSLSSLTSLEDTDLDKDRDRDGDGDAARRSKTPAAVTSKSRGTSSRSRSKSKSKSAFSSTTTSNTRHSEPYRAPSTSRLSASIVRAVSEATYSARALAGSVGGPSASMDELALLARRAPLKIHLKMPGAMRGVKRKWVGDGDGGEGQGEGQGVDGDVMPTDEALHAEQGNEDVPPGLAGATPAPGIRTPMSPVSRPAAEGSASDLFGMDAMAPPAVPVPRKRKKKHSQGVDHAAHTVSQFRETSQPPRIETPAPLAPECSTSTSNGFVDSAREHPDTASRKKTKKESEPARGRGRPRKVKRGGKAKPKKRRRGRYEAAQRVHRGRVGRRGGSRARCGAAPGSTRRGVGCGDTSVTS